MKLLKALFLLSLICASASASAIDNKKHLPVAKGHAKHCLPKKSGKAYGWLKHKYHDCEFDESGGNTGGGGQTPPPTNFLFQSGQFCTYSQSIWGATSQSSDIANDLHQKFYLKFPQGVNIGSFYVATFSTAQSVTDFLPSSGAPSRFSTNHLNPLTTEAGSFAGEVLALRLNISGIAIGTYGNYGSLRLKNTDSALDGMEIYQVFQILQDVLGGGVIAPEIDLYSLNLLTKKLNEAFLNCAPNQWAKDHLQVP